MREGTGDFVQLSKAIGRLDEKERQAAEKQLVTAVFDLRTYYVTGTDNNPVPAFGLLDTPQGPMGGVMSTIYYDDPEIVDYFEHVLTDPAADDQEAVVSFMQGANSLPDFVPYIVEDLKDLGRADINDDLFADAVENVTQLYSAQNVYQRFLSY